MKSNVTLEIIAISKIEREAIETVIKWKSYVRASKHSKFSAGNLRRIFFRMRMRDRKAKAFRKQMEAYRKRLGVKKKYLNSG